MRISCVILLAPWQASCSLWGSTSIHASSLGPWPRSTRSPATTFASMRKASSCSTKAGRKASRRSGSAPSISAPSYRVRRCPRPAPCADFRKSAKTLVPPLNRGPNCTKRSSPRALWMPQSAPLISTLVFGLVLAFGFGLVAQRLRLPPLVGYLLAGIAIGPFTPGFVADQSAANQLAEIGVILLMFGVGLHFSLEDLLSVRDIAIPGALAQALVATPLGMAVGWWQGWTPGAGLVFGIALSIASTVVLLRLFQERRLLDTERGRISVGWLVVQDLGMVLVLVLLPVLAGLLKGTGDAPDPTEFFEAIALTLGKIAAFVVVMLLVGRKVIPLILHYVAHTGSRELFRLAVLSIALGFAYLATELFGVSLALGAFFAGLILSESRLSQQAATESLPLRDAFAVL